MVNPENERGGHRPSQRLSTPTDSRVASPDAGSLRSCTQRHCNGIGTGPYPSRLHVVRPSLGSGRDAARSVGDYVEPDPGKQVATTQVLEFE